MKKRVAVMMILLLVGSGSLSSVFNIQPAKTVAITIRVPVDYPTIQGAIDAANPGDTIYVYNGTYHEHVVVNKAVSLVGEVGITVIDGDGTGTVVTVTANNAMISDFTIQNSGSSVPFPKVGIYLNGGNYAKVQNNRINNNYDGIYAESSHNNDIYGNNITNNLDSGIRFIVPNNNSIHENNLTENRVGIYLDGSQNNTVYRNNIINNKDEGIIIGGAYANNIYGNILANNSDGCGFSYSSNNALWGNNVTNNRHKGISLCESSNNRIYHNNFDNDGNNVFDYSWLYEGYASSVNVWSNGYPSGGNFWSDYASVDANGDGIGDMPYVIDADNQDRYPLMYPSSPLPVHNMNTGLAYATVQEAIDAYETLSGQTIFVEAGTYYENIVINKTVSLVGENQTTTIIDGNYTEDVMTLNADDIGITSFTIQNSGDYGSGINAYSSGKNNLSYNIITHNLHGISLSNTSSNSMAGNKIANNMLGIYFWSTSNNSITENNITENMGFGIALDSSSDNSISRNTLTGSMGHGISLGSSSDNSITENNITGNMFGIELSYSSNNSISGNNVANNMNGIGLYSSSNNTLSGNNVTANSGYGIRLSDSSNSTFCHNTFINNALHVRIGIKGYANSWDDGYPSGGNYWSDHNGTDLYSGSFQNETSNDGISDMPYTIDANNTDRYPLMGMFSDFNATSDCRVQTVCNSSISSFQFNGSSISFTVTGEDGTSGFCRICIPTTLMNATYRVFVNGTEVQYNRLPCSNSCHSYLYFTYSHSTDEIVIVPEFAPLIILPLFITVALLAVGIYRKKQIW